MKRQRFCAINEDACYKSGGKCCYDCSRRDRCKGVCLNSPEVCGMNYVERRKCGRGENLIVEGLQVWQTV